MGGFKPYNVFILASPRSMPIVVEVHNRRNEVLTRHSSSDTHELITWMYVTHVSMSYTDGIKVRVTS